MPRFFFELTDSRSHETDDDDGVEFARSSDVSIAGAVALAHMFADQLRQSHLADRITMLIRDEARTPVARVTISCDVQLLPAE